MVEKSYIDETNHCYRTASVQHLNFYTVGHMYSGMSFVQCLMLTRLQVVGIMVVLAEFTVEESIFLC